MIIEWHVLLAPLMLRTDIFINDANVVSKPTLNFWNDLKKLD